MIQCRKIN